MAELTRSTRSIVPQTRYDNDAHERVQVKVKVSKFKTTFFLFYLDRKFQTEEYFFPSAF